MGNINPRARVLIAATLMFFLAIFWMKEKIKDKIKYNIIVAPQPTASAGVRLSTLAEPTRKFGITPPTQLFNSTSKIEPIDLKDETLALAYCKILKSNSEILLSGNLKIYAFNYQTNGDRNDGLMAYVHSSECPKDSFSIINLDGDGRIRDFVDCRTATAEELFLKSSIQGQIEDVPVHADRLPLALSGGGFFLVECGKEFFLQRWGDFHVSGQEIKSGGCKLLDQNGKPFLWDGNPLDQQGCVQGGACLAVVTAPPSAVAYVDQATYNVIDLSKIESMDEVRLFQGALEDLREPNSFRTADWWKTRSPFVRPVECRD